MNDALEWLIRKGGYFYRPNMSGYTTAKHEAGRYTKEDAEREARIEPWHMKAIHENEWPDDKISAKLSTLAAENERLRADLAAAEQARAVAEHNLALREASVAGLRKLIGEMVALMARASEASSRSEDVRTSWCESRAHLIARAKGAAAS